MDHQPRKNKNRHSGKRGIWIIRILLVITVLAVGTVTFIALQEGSMKASVREGITLNPEVTAPPPTSPTVEITEDPEAPTETTEEPTEPADPVLEQAMRYLEAMSTEEKLCQMIITSPDEITDVYGATQAAEGTRAALEQYPVGGLVYEVQNLQSATQLQLMISNSQSYSRTPMFIGIAEEGGNQAPLASIGLTSYYSNMSVYGEEENITRISEIGGEMAEDMLSVGFNFNLAPVADVLSNPNNTEVGTRSFGADATMTAELTATMLRSLQEGGITACMKHFPGLASAEGDSRYGQASSQRTLDELRQEELLPYISGIEAGARMILVSHISLPNITGDETPSDLSPAIVTDLLRQELGYDGLILTDSHSKDAITDYYTSADAAVQAILAGCDMILQPENLEETVAGLLNALNEGQLTEERINESVLRILYLKIQMGLI